MADEEPFFDYQQQIEQGDLEMGGIFDEEEEEAPLGDPWADVVVPVLEDPEIAATAALTAYELVPPPMSEELVLFPDYPTISGTTIQENHLSNKQLVRFIFMILFVYLAFFYIKFVLCAIGRKQTMFRTMFRK